MLAGLWTIGFLLRSHLERQPAELGKVEEWHRLATRSGLHFDIPPDDGIAGFPIQKALDLPLGS